MRPGGGKRKGSSFERDVCKKLSRWVTNGAREDVFWRTAISGGRATVAYSKGQDVRQGGDISAVSPEGFCLTDRYYFECKHVKDLGFDQFLIKVSGPLKNFWQKCGGEAARHGREPVIIAKQNGWPILWLSWQCFGVLFDPFIKTADGFCVYLFDDLMREQCPFS